MKRILAATAALAIAGGALADHNTTIVDDRAGVFMDISGTGTALGLTDDGEASITTTIGNALLAAGSVRIGNNGGALWNDAGTENLSFVNGTINGVSPAWGGGQSLLPFWDDLDEETGDVYWQEIGGQLIIQWHQRPHFPGPGAGNVTFQIQVNGNGNGSTIPYAQFLYLDTIFDDSRWDNGLSATVGYQSTNPANNVEWSFNQAVITDGLVLSIVDVPAPGALALLGAAGLVARRRRRA
ncbi:MAG: hypothetical protein ACR2GY_02065 [Phycisphaerales bacterium]